MGYVGDGPKPQLEVGDISTKDVTATGDLTVDTNTLYVDSTNNNVLIGKTSSSFSTDGIEASAAVDANGWVLWATGSPSASGGVTAFNRTGSDGTIMGFYKGNSNVGSIGTASSYPYLAAPANFSLMLVTSDFRPRTVTGSSNNDNTVDIGVSNSRFKDLYLGGGAYIGGTGSANKLDDYEEGTWTPVVAQGWTSVTFPNSYQNGNYTKIGNMVTAWFFLQFSGTNASQHVRISGLPFNSANEPAGPLRGGAVTYFSIPVNSAGTILPYVVHNSNYLEFYNGNDAAGGTTSNANAAGNYLIGSVTYRTS